MRIFLTGATGYIGGAVLDALVRAGHEVTALVRDKQKAALVAGRGGRPVVGNLAEPASYGDLDAQDAYVHTAFDAASGRGPAIDRIALSSFVEAANRSGAAGEHAQPPRAIVYTSGVWVLGRTNGPADEDAPVNPIDIVAWRPEHEQMVLGASLWRVRPIVVRPALVYGGSSGIIGDLFKAAGNGLVRVVGDGTNHWAVVHYRDLAELYARVVATQTASGIYHANDESDERVEDIVSAVAACSAVQPDVRRVPLEEARAQMGGYADALALDQIVRSRRSRELGWASKWHSVSRNAARLLEESRSGSE
jgi:nucleoside-diphosphate-sugar epimerase